MHNLKPHHFKDFIFICALSLVIVLPYLSIIGLNKDLVLGSSYGDMADMGIPIRGFEVALLSKGIFPLWNPYILSGTSRIADSQLFYPFTYIHLFLPLSLTFNLLIVLHQVMAGIFMYLYIRHIIKDSFSSFIGAVVFSLSSAFIMRIFAGHLSIIFATAWIPLLFLLMDKALSKKGAIFTLLAGLVLSLQIFGGHIQFVFITLVGLFLYAVYMTFKNYRFDHSIKKFFQSVYAFGSFVILGIGISAVQLLPAIELSKGALRFTDPLWNYLFSMPPENIITILSPGFFGGINQGAYWGKWCPWEITIYVGILPLLLSFFAMLKGGKYHRFFTGLFLVSLLLSFGAYVPIYRFLYKYLVGFNLFRANGRFLILGVFSLSVLTALGYAALKENKAREVRRKAVSTVIFGFILIFVLATLRFILLHLPLLWGKIFSFLVSYDKLSLRSGFNFGYMFYAGFANTISDLNYSIVLITLGILLFIVYLRNFLSEGFKKTLVALFIFSDLLCFVTGHFSVFPIENCYLNKKIASFLHNNIGLSRYLPLSLGGRNMGILDEIPSIGGYSVCVPARYNEFINFTQGMPLSATFILDPITKPSRLFELLNLKYILTNGLIKDSAYSKVYSNGNLNIYQTPASLPKAFIVHKAKVIPDRDNILKTLSDDSFNFRDTVILEEPVNLAGVNKVVLAAEPEPVIATYSPNRVVIKADTKADGYLILCDNYYPGWRAYVDARRTRILRANYILRAVPLHPGNHTIEFIYSPASLKIGAFITLSFLALSIIMLIILIKKRNF
jgi:hypothetical protein